MRVAPDQHCVCSWQVPSRTIETFLAYSAIERIEQKPIGFASPIARFSDYSGKPRTATRLPRLPALVRNGHSTVSDPGPLLGEQRTSNIGCLRSAFDPEVSSMALPERLQK